MSENCEETFYSVTLNPSAWFWQVPSLSIVLCLSEFVSYLHEKREISLIKIGVAFHKVLIWYYLPCQKALRSGPLLLEPAHLFASKKPMHVYPQWSWKPWGSSALELKRFVQWHASSWVKHHVPLKFSIFLFLKLDSKDWKFRLSYFAILNTNKNGWKGR